VGLAVAHEDVLHGQPARSCLHLLAAVDAEAGVHVPGLAAQWRSVRDVVVALENPTGRLTAEARRVALQRAIADLGSCPSARRLPTRWSWTPIE
jgi:S1-C subfamily serine protease